MAIAGVDLGTIPNYDEAVLDLARALPFAYELWRRVLTCSECEAENVVSTTYQRIDGAFSLATISGTNIDAFRRSQ